MADRLVDIAPLLRDGQRVLEIGCAEGYLGARVKCMAKVDYTGVEPSQDADAASAVLDRVVRGTSATVTDGPYHLLLAFHVLEHIRDIAAEVARWHYLLGAAGTALIEVPDDAGHPLLSWDTNAEHLHYFTAASIAALCQRNGLKVAQLTSGHFESAVYPDSLRVVGRPRVSDECRRATLIARFVACLSGPFVVYGVGGDFRNYVEPVLDALPVAALIDSDPNRHGQRINHLTVMPFDPEQHGTLPVLIASARFNHEIATWLINVHGVSADRICSLADIYNADGLASAPGEA